MPRLSNKPLQLLKGFRDILPEHQPHWDFFITQALILARNHGFQKIDIPLLEATNLYIKGTGKHTDIVVKELYEFTDKDGESITLRPEFTPGICRAYIEHGMINQPQPVKLFTYGPVFRHDNPQAGRFRQFHQFDFESIGSDSPVIDAQLVIVGYRLLEMLGLPAIVHINSIGCPACRSAYLVSFKQYLNSAGRKKGLCDLCKDRFVRNPLRILDCKEESCQSILSEAPHLVDVLCDDCRKHFMQVLEQLDDLDIIYQLDVNLVRGLDYYNRTTFEYYAKDSDNEKAQAALGGGGRYDGLMEILGGRPTPAAGLAMGVERIITRLRENNAVLPAPYRPDLFIAQLGVDARKECFKLFERFSAAGFKIAESFSKDGLKTQLEKADSLGVKLCLILGQRELLDHTIILRDMSSGIQEIINYDHVMAEVQKRLGNIDSAVKSYVLETDNRGAAGSSSSSDTVSEGGVAPDNRSSESKPKYKLDLDDNESIINEL